MFGIRPVFHSLTVGTWENHLNTLSLRLLICKTKVVAGSQCGALRVKDVMYIKRLTRRLAYVGVQYSPYFRVFHHMSTLYRREMIVS